MDDKTFVEYLIKGIVNNPDQVTVTRTVDELGVLLTVKVSAGDMGMLIGREGSTAKAIRTLARIIGMKNEARVNLKIEEPDSGRADPVPMNPVIPTQKSADEIVGGIS